MSPAELQGVARLHAIVAWAATAALVVAPWWLRARGESSRGVARVACAAAVGLLLAAGGLGLALHEGYRAKIRQRLFIGTPSLGWLFERKLHVAFAAVLLGVGALATLARLERARLDGAGAEERRDLARSAALAWGASAALALAASIASAIVARRSHF